MQAFLYAAAAAGVITLLATGVAKPDEESQDTCEFLKTFAKQANAENLGGHYFTAVSAHVECLMKNYRLIFTAADDPSTYSFIEAFDVRNYQNAICSKGLYWTDAFANGWTIHIIFQSEKGEIRTIDVRTCETES